MQNQTLTETKHSLFVNHVALQIFQQICLHLSSV